jgi:hypothetical protein
LFDLNFLARVISLRLPHTTALVFLARLLHFEFELTALGVPHALHAKSRLLGCSRYGT